MHKNLLLHTLTQIALNEGITELKYKDMIITLVDSYGELDWRCDYCKLRSQVYDAAFKRWAAGMRRYGYGASMDISDYEYELVKREILHRQTPDLENFYSCYDLTRYWKKIKDAFEKAAKKSPLDDSWFIEQIRIKIPWASIEEIAERAAESLNESFLPIAQVVGVYKSFISNSDTVHVGHYKGYPILWQYEYTWSRASQTLLDTVTVCLDHDRFVVQAGAAGSWYIRNSIELQSMVKELPLRIIKLWLESSDRRMSVLSLWEQGVMLDDGYDSHIYHLKSGDPGFFDLKKTAMVREDVEYIDLYLNVEENLKKEENNG